MEPTAKEEKSQMHPDPWKELSRVQQLLRESQQRDAWYEEELQRIQQERDKQEEEPLQSQQENEDLNQKVRRLEFPVRLASEPPATLAELLTRIYELNLPPVDHEESISEAVAAAFQSKAPTSAGTLHHRQMD
eukprot:gene19861-14453_t